MRFFGLLVFGLAAATMACADDDALPVGMNDRGDAGIAADTGGEDTGGEDASADAGHDAGADVGFDTGTADSGADAGPRLVDIIIVSDNSVSMVAENASLEFSVNSFLATVDAAGIEPKIVMVTNHGGDDTDVCIPLPLGSSDCAGAPGNRAIFAHYDVDVASQDGLCVLVETYLGPNAGGPADEHGQFPNGWRSALRAGAEPVFIVLGDDGVDCDAYDDSNSGAGGQTVATAFDIDLTQLDGAKFGTPQNRRYVVHSIVAGIPVASQPLEPTDPVSTTVCAAGAAPGTGQQALSVATGGLRFSSCAFEVSADVVFDTIAREIIGPR